MACTFTLADAQAALGQRLYDPTSQFWPDAEKTRYIQEAMRTWNALTAYWRGDFLFTTQPGIQWYDFTDIAAMPATLRALTLTDGDLYQLLEYHLLEPLTTFPQVWAGSAQFAISDLQQAVQRRRDEALGSSGCSITRTLVASTPGQTRYALPDATLDLRRLAFLPASGFGSARSLLQSDIWAEQNLATATPSATPPTPRLYRMSTQPFLRFDVTPPAGVPGQWDLLTVAGGAQLSLATASPLVVPDDWAWVVKWGALADLLGRESNAKDSLRAQYAEQRYQDGLRLLTAAPALLSLTVNGLPLRVDTVRGADLYKPGWQALAAGLPRRAYVAGLNLVALSPAPDAAVPTNYSVEATVVENAPVPAASGDCIDLSRDYFDVIVDYAQHIATFKQGGAEFSATIPLYQRFITEAALYVSKRAQMGEFTQILDEISHRNEELAPRLSMEAQGG